MDTTIRYSASCRRSDLPLVSLSPLLPPARSYELQVKKEHRTKGYGKTLMQVVEQMGMLFGCEASMLTVLKASTCRGGDRRAIP